MYGKTVERGGFLIDVSPKCRAPHIHRPFPLPIAQIHSKTASKHNAAEHCARHDHRQNPIACCSGCPKYHRPRRGSQYGNSDYEPHRGTRFLCFIKEHDSWTCTFPKNRRLGRPAMQMQLKFQVELSTRLVCSQNRSLSVRRLASFGLERTVADAAQFGRKQTSAACA